MRYFIYVAFSLCTLQTAHAEWAVINYLCGPYDNGARHLFSIVADYNNNHRIVRLMSDAGGPTHTYVDGQERTEFQVTTRDFVTISPGQIHFGTRVIRNPPVNQAGRAAFEADWAIDRRNLIFSSYGVSPDRVQSLLGGSPEKCTIAHQTGGQ